MTLLDTPDDLVVDPSSATDHEWVDVCGLDDLLTDRGVCALVDGAAVAVFRCWPDDELFAIGNHDPFSDASVLSRGIVGSIGERPVVASPIFKHRFDLRTGTSLDDERVAVPVFPVVVAEGRVRVGRRPARAR